MKARLLLISRKWPPAIGGMETYSVELAASLGEDFDVEILALPGRDDGHAPSLLAYGWFVLKAMTVCLFRGRAYANVIFGDLVLFPAAVCHWIVARRSRRLVVVYGLDLVYQSRRGLLAGLYRLFFASFRKCQGVFSTIVAISRYTAELAGKAGLRDVVVINPSLPKGGLVDADLAHGDLPDSWKHATRRVLYFGRLVPRKGSLRYAENVLPHLADDVDFFVVGQSSNAEFKKQLQQCKRTHSLGRVDAPRLAAMIRAADVVVMPNIPTPYAVDVEGFGLAAIEASALGGRLLASSIDGITDAVIDGETGTLVPPGDSSEWARATTHALATPSAELLSLRTKVAGVTRETYSRHIQSTAFTRLLRTADLS